MARGERGASWVGSVVDPSLAPTLHTDTTAVSDPAAPSGTAAGTSFASSPGAARRWELRVPETAEGGAVDVWVAVRSDPGVRAELELRSSGRSIGRATVAPPTEYGALRLGRLGRPGSVDVEGWARRTAGTGGLYWDRVWLAPAGAGFVPPIPPLPGAATTGQPGETTAPAAMAVPRRGARMALIAGGAALALIGAGAGVAVTLSGGSGSAPPPPPPPASTEAATPTVAAAQPLPGKIVFSCLPNGLSICEMNPDGTDFRRVVKGGGEGEVCCGHPALSPTGANLAYEGAEGTFTIADAHGQNPLFPSWEVPGCCFSPAWSPQGDRLALWDEGGFIRIDNADGSQTGLVIPAPGASPEGGLAWSPDGTEIAFVSSSGGIDAVAISGGEPRPILSPGTPAAPDAPEAVALTWAPGSSLLFEASGPTGTIIEEVNGDGTGLRPLLPGAGHISPNYSSPSWAPDGVHFLAIRNGRIVIATVAHGIQDILPPRGVIYAQWG